MTAKDGVRQGAIAGAVIGVAYGIFVRALADSNATDALRVMSLSFLVVAPASIGYLTVRPHPTPSWLYRICAPWGPIVISVLVAVLVGWEGAICVVFALPILLVFASFGGLIAGMGLPSKPPIVGAIALLPFLLAPLEGRWPEPIRLHTIETSIDIAAPPSMVWQEIVSVRPIESAERHPALFTAIGFPQPISAELSGTGVGALRRATFERGVLFFERVTDWDEQRHLRFTIAAQTDSIPPAALDQHVTIGGRYFDVLTGDYRLVPLPDDRTRLVLTSEVRVSTHFNLYATPWADAIMGSIQRNILAVEKARAEKAESGGGR